MDIRQATQDDVDGIVAIWNDLITNTDVTFTTDLKTRDQISAVLLDKADLGRPFFVAEDEGQIIGFATYGNFRNGSGYAHSMEHSIMLVPAAQGKGAGKQMMQILEDHAKRSGVHTFVGGINSNNKQSIKFHEAIGYQTVGDIKQAGFKFGCWHDLVLMQKLL
ncbi:N-acetyltransferase [Amylibacter sp. SFDW26]|uniref:GNAT family N-acetyltransferase n=1 Tax=Amylibacter sp. SFDW26 TaxID=2652722 RepID=UPI001262094D|nr:GNAT family N-acetyltransferase [Amylibacter sp. SFDW26]KAB7615362.1 N-acetyltransferase [Amylibacter sp. SFDW26]